MHQIRRWTTAAALAAAALLGGPAVSPASAADPNGDTFTYQGKLTQGGSPVTEAVDLTFALFDALAGGNQVGVTLSAAAFDAFDDNGLFTIDLTFGKGVLNGQPRWLEISVNGTALSPRQPLMPAPYAVRALTLGTLADESFMGSYTNQVDLSNASNQFSGSGAGLTNLNLTGTYGNAVNFSNAGNAFTGSGAGLTSLNAGNISAGTLPIVRGGTGAITAAGALTNLDAQKRVTGSAPVGSYLRVINADGSVVTGTGSALTGLNASNITTGTLSDSQLSSNVALRNAANTFTANNIFNSTVGIGEAASNAKLQVRSAADEEALRVRVANTTRLLVNANGGVGIGSSFDDVPAGFLRVSGRVGSGTSDPQSWLHVVRASSTIVPQAHLESTTNNGFARLRLSTTGQTSYWEVAGGGSDNRVDFWNSETGSLMYLQGSTERIGIGTTGPQTKLDVNGGIRSRANHGNATPPVIGSMHRDSVIHAWARVSGNGTLLEGYGISNVFKIGPGRYDVMYSQVYANAPIPVVTVRSSNDPVFPTANAITDRVTVVTHAFVGGNFSASDREFYIILTGRVQN